MKTRVQKWGNSLAVRIPKAFAEEAGLDDGSPVDISQTNGTLLVSPVREKRPTLAQLLDQVTDDNIHSEHDTGQRTGREAW